MRVSREEESYFGRARTSMVGRAKMGLTRDDAMDASQDAFISAFRAITSRALASSRACSAE